MVRVIESTSLLPEGPRLTPVTSDAAVMRPL